MAAALNRVVPAQSGNQFGILVYHRVAEAEPRSTPPTWNVSPDRLHRQLEGLLNAGYTALPLRRALSAHAAKEPLPARSFAVTFDDGYANNLTRALPVLERLQVPATIFLATAFLDSPEPFPSDDWPLAGAPAVPGDSWRPLTSDEVHQLLRNPLIEIGCHTHTHRDFRQIPEEFRQDLEHSLGVLGERFGIAEPTFAFPFGYATPEMLKIAEQVGLLCALTTEPEPVPAQASPFGWGRFRANQFDSPSTLRGKLDGWYSRLSREGGPNSALGKLGTADSASPPAPGAVA